jgi:YidC/Oxa1 family membrane protein insertase
MILATIPIFSQLEGVMKHVLNFFHSSVGLPWAWSIVATTVVVRMILVPLTIRQIHSMQNLQKFAPQMKEIKK